MHLDEEQFQRLLHRELGGHAKKAAERHLTVCDACRARFAEIAREEEWAFDLLSRLDAAPPDIDAETVARRARAGSLVLAVWVRRAAVIVLVLGLAGAAYTAPGSPMPGWVHRLLGGSPRSTTRSQEPPVRSSPILAGIAVVPGERFSIRFEAHQPRGVAVVSLTNDSTVAVRAMGVGATFATDVDRITIENRDASGDFEIDVPRTAPWVEIEVGDRRCLLKEGSRIVTNARVDSAGRYFLDLMRSDP